jgi:uncharacterized membrane protein
MAQPAVEDSPSSRRAVDRLINFSDAVVAVAVTVLVLPLVDISGPSEGQTVWDVFTDHAGQIITFLFTFLVVAIMWLAHNRILNRIRAYDGTIFWLNTVWLVAIVLLPWFSAMYGESHTGANGAGTGLVYWVDLAVISAMGSLMSAHLRRRGELTHAEEAESPQAQLRAALRGPVFGGYFLLIGIVSLFAPSVASWMPFGIIVLSVWLRPVHEDQGDVA